VVTKSKCQKAQEISFFFSWGEAIRGECSSSIEAILAFLKKLHPELEKAAGKEWHRLFPTIRLPRNRRTPYLAVNDVTNSSYLAPNAKQVAHMQRRPSRQQKRQRRGLLVFSELLSLPSAGSRSGCFHTSLGCKPRSLMRVSLG
jgi:hypothetical protein